jgi:single-strand DNA-binding protein
MYQQLTIIGRLGADPELRYTPAGVPVCSFNVATDRAWNNDQGQKQTETTWHRVTVWRKRAEVCAQYLSKGKMVLVTGSVKASGFTNRDGQISASLEVTADQVTFLSSSGAGAAEGAGGASGAAGAVVDDEAIPF